jgi:hypothetical protein
LYGLDESCYQNQTNKDKNASNGSTGITEVIKFCDNEKGDYQENYEGRET